MKFKRRVLSALSRSELLELGRNLELEVTTRMTADDLRDALARSKRARLERLVTPALSQERLRSICEACGLDSKSKGKQPLIDRILVAGGEANGDGAEKKPTLPGIDELDEDALAAAKASLAAVPRVKRGARAAEGGVDVDGTQILAYGHGQRRRNNPEVGMVDPDSDPVQPRTRWSYDPHIDPALQFDVRRAQVESIIDDALEAGDEESLRAALEQLRRQAAPYLAWTGKAERTSFEVDTVSLHVHERIEPASILAAVHRSQKARKGKAPVVTASQQLDMWSAPFENLPLHQAMDFYKHDKGWSNRLVAGDSLLVMNSLLQKEGMAGQVQMIYIDPPYGIRYGSNFQPFVNKRDVKDRKDEDLTQEPEMIKAFRDTWELGIHSYLTYLRDRLLLARDLLQESGSIFVQISDENLHHVRELMDDVFGESNFCSLITFAKNSGATDALLANTSDYLLWYAKKRAEVTYHQLYHDKSAGSELAERYDQVLEVDGRERRLKSTEKAADLPAGTDLFTFTPAISQGFRPATSVPFSMDGFTCDIGKQRNWKTSIVGMTRLAKARRLTGSERMVYYKRRLSDFPAHAINASWTDTQDRFAKDFIVQTVPRVVERCILMTTAPGDLVFDPTCGSGTTAAMAEKWGRRWMTCDTSRVAITLSKQRLLTATYNYYELKYPHEGLKGGFIYRWVPHVTLKSIGNDPEIDEIYERVHPAIEAALAELNAALKREPPAESFLVLEGVRKGNLIDFAKGATLDEWEVPFDLPAEWPAAARGPFDRFHAERQAMQKQIDASIAAHAEQEILYDQPRVAKDKIRITGPFTVEAVPFPTVYALDETAPAEEADMAIARSGESSRQHQWRDELLKTGIRGKGGQMLKLASLETLPDTRYVHGSGTLADSGDRVVVSFGPEHGALEQRQVEMAMREAGELFPRPKMIVFCAFVFDPEAAKDIDQTKGIVALKAQMNTDLLTEDLKKARASNQSFWLMGQPDVEVRKRKDGLYEVEVHGFDYFDTAKGDLVSGGKSKIAAWALDSDYDERSLLPRQVFFPMAGAKDGWYRLRKDLRAELDEKLLEKFHGTVSLPFEPGENRKVAVKVVDDRGIESLKVMHLD